MRLVPSNRKLTVHRKFVQRGHRLPAMYLALYAWVHEIDCVILDRGELFRFWGIKRNDKRKWYLIEDFKHYFAYCIPFGPPGSKSSCFFFSQKDMSGFTKDEKKKNRNDEECHDAMKQKGISAERVKIPPEAAMLARLTAAVHGLEKF